MTCLSLGRCYNNKANHLEKRWVMDSRHERFLVNMFGLEGRVIVVAGAGTIGIELALGLGLAGATVAVCDKSEEKLKAARIQLATAGTRFETYCFDLSAPENCVELARWTVRDFGHIDGLVTATTFNGRTPFLGVTPELYDTITTANFRVPFFLSQAIAKQMAANGDTGCIVHISSVNANIPTTNNTVYAASKAALSNLVLGQASELAPIRVMGIELGFVVSDLTKEIRADQRNNSVLEHTALGRMAEPREVSGPVIALMAAAGSFASGSIWGLHGGYPLWDWTAEG